MRYRYSKTRTKSLAVKAAAQYDRAGLTLLEMVIALAIMVIVFAAVLPQFRVVANSLDSKSGAAETIQTGRVLTDHLNRNLAKAVKITAVSDLDETNGYVEFQDNDGNSLRYEISDSYVRFGTVGDLWDLAGPVSKLQFTCYDDSDLDTPLDPVTDTSLIRFVKAETTVTNSAAAGRDQTFVASTYLRTGATSLVAWWKLDETSGTTAKDSSGNGNDGTLVNMEPATDWVTGKVAGALDFDGTNDYIKVNDSGSLDIGNTFTAALWVNYEGGSTPDNYERMLTKKAAWDSLNGWEISLETGYDDNLTVRGSSGAGSAGADMVVSSWAAEGWHHIAVVYEGTTATVYSDGVERDTVTIASVVDNDLPLYIGRYGDGQYCHWNGKIDDVRIYSRALSAEEIAQLAAPGPAYQQFAEAKTDADTTSITISTPAASGDTVTILGSWTLGLSHTAESGSNRLLVFTAHAEDDDTDMNLSSVTYGGQSMTKVVEKNVGTDYRAYTAAYILNEAGISAASGNSFEVTWAQTPYRTPAYSSVFLSDVDQTTPAGASASNSTTSSGTVSTSALSTNDGDMVIVAGTCGNEGTYSVNNGFTEAIELSMTSSDGIAGYKSADGSGETPSITHSYVNRQVIIGFVVQADQSGGIDTIEGELLIAAVATDGDTSASLTPPGGEGWTEISLDDYSNETTLGVWWKLADALESESHEFTWSGDEQAYGWMMRFTDHDPTDPINVIQSQGADANSSPPSPAVTTTVDDCLILRLGAFDDDDITVDSPGLSGHTAITMDKSGTSGVTYEQFTEAKAASDTTSITISTPADTNEADLLIAAVATDGSEIISPPGGEGWTEIDVDNYNGAVTLGAWWKNADASESPSHQFTWSGAEQAYGWMMLFTGHDPTGPVDVSATNGESSSTPTSPAVTTTANNSLILRLGAFDDDDITVDAPGLAGHTAITMDESADSAGQVTYEGGTEKKRSSGSTSITIDTPSNTGEDDLLVAVVITDGDTSTSLAPPGGEGWTEVNLNDYGSAVTLGVWWKLAGASESSSHQFTWSGSQQAYGGMMRFTGHDPTIPINASAATGGNAGWSWSSWSYNATSPSVTTTVANCLILRIGGFDDDDITVDDTGLDNGHTDITMDESNSGSGTCSGGAGYKQQAAIGSSGTVTFDLTRREQYRTVTIAITPDTSDAGTVSGGAGYVQQLASGSSGTSTFSLTASQEAQMLTIAISPPGGLVSGGAGYLWQSASGSSGTSTFSLTAAEQSQTVTVGIAPDPENGDLIYP